MSSNKKGRILNHLKEDDFFVVLDYNRYMQRKIFKTGHSAAVTLSTGLLKDMGLRVGDTVKIEISTDKEEIIIRHGKKANQLPLGLKLRPKL